MYEQVSDVFSQKTKKSQTVKNKTQTNKQMQKPWDKN